MVAYNFMGKYGFCVGIFFNWVYRILLLVASGVYGLVDFRGHLKVLVFVLID